MLIFTTPSGIKRAAEIYAPLGDDPAPALLYVHWYEPESPDSNRTQFIKEAETMAKRGAVCMLIETLWSDIDFFLKRTQADDEPASIRQVIELRQAMDILLAEPQADASRFAYIGHDFGGMYGVLTGSIDSRPTHYVIMAATPRFPDWYLYYPRLEGPARADFIQQMQPYDPIEHIGNLAPAPIFFQFATDDLHVPKERADAFYAAANDPKQMGWYTAGHGLNEQATTERMAWLTEHLQLKA